MSSIVISGDTSGAVSIAAPAIAGTNTMTLVAGTGSLAPKVLGTAVASTSGTSIDFTNIPSWATRIIIMFNAVSLSGTSTFLVQIGSGSVVTSGYSSASYQYNNSTVSSTAGFIFTVGGSANYTSSGAMTLTNFGASVWVATHGGAVNNAGTNSGLAGGGISPTLSGVLDRVRITTVNGTDTFDAGSINIMYE